MRSLIAACISLFLVGGLCVAQADGPKGLFAGDRIDPAAVQVVPSDDLLTGDWCATNRVWAQRAKDLGLGERGGCPLEGDCDDPVVRDKHIPDLSAPFKNVRLRFVVFREDDGSNPAATENDIIAQAEQINLDCAPYRVRIVYSYDFIDDSIYRYVTNNEIWLMRNLYAESPDTQCNVYVTDFTNVGGMGTFPWDPIALTTQGGILIDNSMFGPGQNVMTHELGHNIGLWHTHHGVSEFWGECMNDGDPCDCLCYERADGTDADTTGDFCSDTPPTPVNNRCYGPGGNDPCSNTPWGETQPENFMSYGGNGCWSLFTEQQAGRVHCWIEAALSTWLVCPGDLDGDGDSDQSDLGILLSDWECTGGACPGDLDGDGDTDQGDLGILLADWGCGV